MVRMLRGLQLLPKAEAAFVACATGVAITGLLRSAWVSPKLAIIAALADVGAGSCFVYHQVQHRKQKVGHDEAEALRQELGLYDGHPDETIGGR